MSSFFQYMVHAYKTITLLLQALTRMKQDFQIASNNTLGREELFQRVTVVQEYYKRLRCSLESPLRNSDANFLLPTKLHSCGCCQLSDCKTVHCDYLHIASMLINILHKNLGCSSAHRHSYKVAIF